MYWDSKDTHPLTLELGGAALLKLALGFGLMIRLDGVVTGYGTYRDGMVGLGLAGFPQYGTAQHGLRRILHQFTVVWYIRVFLAPEEKYNTPWIIKVHMREFSNSFCFLQVNTKFIFVSRPL